MSEIEHIGKVFVLGKQGRDMAKISESQLLECLEILRKEFDSTIGCYGEPQRLPNWNDVVEYLQDQSENNRGFGGSNGGGP